MQRRIIISIISLITIFSVLYIGCTPSSFSLRYKDTSDIKTHEDSLKVGLIKDEDDDLLYYSQVQDTSSEFQMFDDEDESSIDEQEVDISVVLAKIKTSENYSDSGFTDTTPKERMLMEIIKYMDTPYQFGGTSKDGIDCSAFTQNIFSNSLDINLYRSAREQYTQGYPIRDKGDLIFGDLVFFNTRKSVRPGHVGIYLGDNLFAHASSKNGVIVSSLDHKYYSKRYMSGRRMNEVFSKNQ
jgi:cell wall-associated NlpC family hydrolase